eukprot:781137-Prymnesium_polylepis.1
MSLEAKASRHRVPTMVRRMGHGHGQWRCARIDKAVCYTRVPYDAHKPKCLASFASLRTGHGQLRFAGLDAKGGATRAYGRPGASQTHMVFGYDSAKAADLKKSASDAARRLAQTRWSSTTAREAQDAAEQQLADAQAAVLAEVAQAAAMLRLRAG